MDRRVRHHFWGQLIHELGFEEWCVVITHSSLHQSQTHILPFFCQEIWPMPWWICDMSPIFTFQEWRTYSFSCWKTNLRCHPCFGIASLEESCLPKAILPSTSSLCPMTDHSQEIKTSPACSNLRETWMATQLQSSHGLMWDLCWEGITAHLLLCPIRCPSPWHRWPY